MKLQKDNVVKLLDNPILIEKYKKLGFEEVSEVKETEERKDTEDTEDTNQENNLSDLTIAELKEIANEKGIELQNNAKKDEILKALES